MDIFLILYILSVFSGTKFEKKPKHFNSKYFSFEQCNVLKGVFAVLVVLHHISNQTNSGIIFNCLYHFGVFGTAGFFTISGYGLMTQLNNKREKYLKIFLSKRIGLILIPYSIFFVVYFIYGHFTNGLSIINAFSSLYNGNPIVTNSWYIIAILYLYIQFFINANLLFLKNHKILFLISNIIAVVVYIFICRNLHYGMWWYNTPHCFLTGIFLAMFENKILKFLKKHYLLILFGNLFFITFLYILKYTTKRGSTPNYIITLFFAFALSGIIPIICMKVNFTENILMKNIGKFSLELYLVHGLIMDILSKITICHQNELLFAALVIIVSVIIAWLFHMPINKLCSLYKTRITVKS